MQIKELRQAKDMTQTQLAERMGVDQSSVARWELGERYPSGRRLMELARILGCTIDALYGQASTTEPPAEAAS